MSEGNDFQGIFPAVVTPLDATGNVHFENLQRHLRTLAEEGCQGVLLLGTTGEGPSLSLQEREEVIRCGLETAGAMVVMAGTGCASLVDALQLTRRAFDLGVHAVVVVPPFYYKNPSLEGLLRFYQRLLDEAIPPNGKLFLYHIPQVSQVPIQMELLEALLEWDASRLIGVKDSGGELAYLQALRQRFPGLRVFVGADQLLLQALELGAVGCITAAANLIAPLEVELFVRFKRGEEVAHLQETISMCRKVLERYGPFPSSVKYVLCRRYRCSGWEVRPPLTALSSERGERLIQELRNLPLHGWMKWLSSLEREE